MRSQLLALALVLAGGLTISVAQPPPGVPRTVKIFMLKNADAVKLGDTVTTIFGRQGVTATVDARTNALIVAGDAETLEEVRKLIAELDKPLPPRK
ncbi:MAG: secretin N-terminal domain-containing protein [Gemmataceae bacterium]|nr:hypothetical protein [Gemmata sp.]MDW8198804.1 secretin N-terminal domain-containing protein [Gemmataceae bacterium]